MLFFDIAMGLSQENRMKMKPNVNMLTVDFPDFGPITDAVRKMNMEKRFTGGVRINQGRYRTDAEDSARREKSLSTPLP